ncbi:super-infection exclusion protein B [Staphylococcus equorum]|uniref:super-infection exclusion protein B n=1 Tax=Staphylococcus equorum TaxID=246432 RepID=UPI003D806933
MKILDILKTYSYIFVLLMLIFLVLFVVELSIILWRKWKEKRENKKRMQFLKREQDKLFEDEHARLILNKLYENHPYSVDLPSNNQKVKLLFQLQLIQKSNQVKAVPIYEMNNPHFPYILQPCAEEKLKGIHSVKN